MLTLVNYTGLSKYPTENLKNCDARLRDTIALGWISGIVQCLKKRNCSSAYAAKEISDICDLFESLR